MTKAELVNTISEKLGTEKMETQKIIEAFMHEVKDSIISGENVYLRGFGTFLIKTRAAKIGRNIKQNKSIEIPAHSIAAFKPSKVFSEEVKDKVTVK